MRIQKQLSKKVKDKIYYKYALVLPKAIVENSHLARKQLKASLNRGKIIIEKV